MRKAQRVYAISAMLGLFAFVPTAFADITFTPTAVPDSSTVIYVSNNGIAGTGADIFDATGAGLGNFAPPDTTGTWSALVGATGLGVGHALMVNLADPNESADCSNGTYATCLASTAYMGQDISFTLGNTITYSRSPAGTSVTSPINVSVSFTDFVLDTGCVNTDWGWGIGASDNITQWYGSSFVASTTKNATISMSIPAGTDIYFVNFECYDSLGNVTTDANTIEGNGSTIIFTIKDYSAFLSSLANATSTFSATTGFDISNVLQWAGVNLIELIIGSGLAILYALRAWLVALVMIGAIVYFAYRTFRFFRK